MTDRCALGYDEGLGRRKTGTVAIAAATGAGRQNDHLRTDHLIAKIKGRTISGGIASGSAQACLLGLNVVYTAVLARILSPRDFGLVAMAAVVTGFLQIFKDAGLSTATIQRENITHAQVSNLFWVNVGVSAIASLVMVVAAPLIARFFHQPELVGISIALASAFLFEGLAVQHLALLNRQMRFSAAAAIDVASAFVGAGIGIGMALLHYGYWSLVGGTLSTAACKVTAVWVLSPWRPQKPTRRSETRSLVRFGADLTLVGIVYALSRGFDQLLIGRYLGTEAVGLYSRATALLTRPMERLITPIYSVIVPALSRLQMQPDRYRRAFLQVFEGLAIGGFLFTGLFLPLARPVVLVILGPKWEGAVPIFAALTISALYLAMATATSWLYTSQGRGRELLLSALIGAGLMIASFVVGLFFGPAGVAIAYSASGTLAILPLTFYIAGRTGPVSTRDLWLACRRHSPVLVVVLGATWLTAAASSALVLSPLKQLLVCVPTGLAAGAAGVVLFPPTRRTARHLLAELTGRGL